MDEYEFTLTMALAGHSKHVQHGLVPNRNGYFADRIIHVHISIKKLKS